MPKTTQPYQATEERKHLTTGGPGKEQGVIFKYQQWQKLEKEMATHSSILALEISWTYEPGGL